MIEPCRPAEMIEPFGIDPIAGAGKDEILDPQMVEFYRKRAREIPGFDRPTVVATPTFSQTVASVKYASNEFQKPSGVATVASKNSLTSWTGCDVPDSVCARLDDIP